MDWRLAREVPSRKSFIPDDDYPDIMLAVVQGKGSDAILINLSEHLALSSLSLHAKPDITDQPSESNFFRNINKLIPPVEEIIVPQIAPQTADSKQDEHISGNPNAFTIELAACDPNHPNSFGLLMDAGFECYPNYDYCIFTCPPTKIHPALRKYFIRVTPKPASNFTYDLFICHRFAASNKFSVSWVTEDDLSAIYRLTANLVMKKRLLSYVHTSLREEWQGLSVAKFCIDRFVMGLAVIRPMTIWRYVKHKYNIDEFPTIRDVPEEEIGIVEYFVITPAFANRGDFFIREVLRLTDYKALFYLLHPDELNPEKVKRSYNCLFGTATFLPTFFHFLLPVRVKELLLLTQIFDIESGSCRNI